VSRHRRSADESGQSLAERHAPMTLSNIDRISDREVAELMGVSEQEVASEFLVWREAVKAATNEFPDRLITAVESGRAKVISDPAGIRQDLGGRPRVDGESGEGPSIQVRVRVTNRTRSAVEDIAASQGRTISDVSREALDEYVARHAS